MKYTLLQIVQDILSSMDSDEVSSINDTVESLQVAKVVRTAYFDIISRARLPEHYTLRQLTASGGSTPVLMTIPSDIDHIEWVKYNWATVANPEISMQLVEYMQLNDFLDMQDRLNPNATDVGSMSFTVGSDVNTLLYHKKAAPRYYSNIDDNTLIFDSYDSTVDSYLTGSKSRVYARLSIPWTESDGFTPDLDELQFPLLLSEAKSLAWTELKQSPHPKAEQSAKRGWSQLQNNKHAAGPTSDFDQLPSFGRKY